MCVRFCILKSIKQTIFILFYKIEYRIFYYIKNNFGHKLSIFLLIGQKNLLIIKIQKVLKLKITIFVHTYHFLI